MKSSVIAGVLLAALRMSAPAAQECFENAAMPKAVTVSYDAADERRTVTFSPGADGTLRALDARTGAELWAFTPVELDVTHRTDGLMGELRVLRFDSNLDGTLDAVAGDRLWVYFGMRRGGRYYYALDATDRERPRLLWRLGPEEMPGVGESWATPTVARVRVAGATQNGEHLVVILGGGYDDAAIASGHRIYLVDAASGRLLWYAGGAGGVAVPQAPDLALMRMTAAIPGRVAAIDVDGDRYADRLYAADASGQLWRFDLWNGQDRSRLATGGVIASLGTAASPADARRFFNGPDVALIQRRGADPYYNLAIGTGDRSRPFDAGVQDRLYSIRDHRPFGKRTQSEYDALVPLTDSDLVDITDAPGTSVVPAAAPGWKLELRLHGGWLGEKTLAEAVTVNGTVLFTTFEPAPGSQCAADGRNRVYALSVDQASPSLDLDDDGKITDTDVSAELDQGGIAGEVELKLPGASDDASTPPPGTDPAHDAETPGLQCVVGAEVLGTCVSMRRLMRTFWQRALVE